MNKKTLLQSAAILVVMALIAALYGQFLNNAIVFDDLNFFMMDDAGNLPVSSYTFGFLELRSLPYASLAWTKDLFGLGLIPFHVGNMLLHMATSLSLYFLLIALFDLAKGENSADSLQPHWLAFFGSLVFAMHPVATYAVGYLVQRTILMATLFSLLALLVYVRGSLRQQATWIWMSVPLYYLAVFSKEHAIMLPAVLIAVTPLLHANWRAKLIQRWGVFLALTVVAVFVILAKKYMLFSVYEPYGTDMLETRALNYPLSILTQSWLFFKYAFLWLLPNPAWMSIDMREPFATSLLSEYTLAFIAFVAWGGVACWLLLKRGLKGSLGFGMLFPWLLYMTEFSTVRVQEIFVLYRSYLWVPGAFCVLPIIVHKLTVRVASVVLLLAGVLLFGLSMERLMTLSHPLLVWDDAEKLLKGRTDVPGAWRIYYNRGNHWRKIDQPEKAIADYQQAVALSRDIAEPHGNLGVAYMKTQDWTQAIESFWNAIEISQKNGEKPRPRYIFGLAQAYEKIGDVPKSLAGYRLSCTLSKLGCDKVIKEMTVQESGKKTAQ